VIPTINETSETIEDKLNSLLNQAVTPALMHQIRVTVRAEQCRLINMGYGERAEEFWVLHRASDVRILDHAGIRALHRECHCPGRLAGILPASYALDELRDAGWEIY
jgi:hypothetical protein